MKSPEELEGTQSRPLIGQSLSSWAAIGQIENNNPFSACYYDGECLQYAAAEEYPLNQHCKNIFSV